MMKHSSFSALIDAFESPAALARAVGVEPVIVRMWKYRDRLPAAHFPAVVAAAEEQGVRDVSYELLYALAARRARDAA